MLRWLNFWLKNAQSCARRGNWGDRGPRTNPKRAPLSWNCALVFLCWSCRRKGRSSFVQTWVCIQVMCTQQTPHRTCTTQVDLSQTGCPPLTLRPIEPSLFYVAYTALPFEENNMSLWGKKNLVWQTLAGHNNKWRGSIWFCLHEASLPLAW